MTDPSEIGMTAIVTGAAGVVGAAIAQRVAAADYRVALLDLPSKRLDGIEEELRGKSLSCPCDLSEPDEVVATVASIKKHLGIPQILISNAGIGAVILMRASLQISPTG